MKITVIIIKHTDGKQSISAVVGDVGLADADMIIDSIGGPDEVAGAIVKTINAVDSVDDLCDLHEIKDEDIFI
ncbi:MAG TPA: hypothetical protein VIE65_12490 [Methylobacter sp.]|jgi:hypothetical protein